MLHNSKIISEEFPQLKDYIYVDYAGAMVIYNHLFFI